MSKFSLLVRKWMQFFVISPEDLVNETGIAYNRILNILNGATPSKEERTEIAIALCTWAGEDLQSIMSVTVIKQWKSRMAFAISLQELV